MQDFTRLLVWQKARSLSVAVSSAARFKAGRAPGLRGQLFKSAAAISANIAEGAGRESRVDFARFLTIAIATTSETEHHLIVAGDHGVLDPVAQRELLARTIEVRRMLFGLRKSVLLKEREG